MSYRTFGATTYYLNSSISSTATSITLTSFLEPVSGVAYTMALLDTDIVYATIAPKTSNSEFISFTGITQNANGTATLTGVTRGLAKKYPFTTSSTFKLPHSGQTQFIISNSPQLYNEFVTLDNEETIVGEKTFPAGGNANAPKSGASYTAPTDDLEYASKKYVDNTATGTTNINRIIVAGTAGETIAVDQLVYLKASDGRWWLTDADTAATVENVILGIAQGSGTAGNSINGGVLTQGLNTFSALTLTANTKYYASNTAGGFSSSAGTTEVTVGESQTTTTFLLYPRFDQQLTEDQQDALAGTSGTPSSTNLFVTAKDESRNYSVVAFGADAGANDTYVITLSPVPTAYTNGMTIKFKANTANTGAATINVNSLGAKTIVKYVNTTLADNDIAAGMYCTLIYDGTNFVLQNPIANIVTPSSSYIVNADETLATYYTWTTPLIVSTDAGPTYVIKGFTGTAISNPGSHNGGAGTTDLSWAGAGTIYSQIQGNGSNSDYTAASSKDIRIKYRLKYQGAYGASKYFGIGIADATTTFDDVETSNAEGIRFVLNNATLYTSTGTGAANTNNNVSASLTYTNWNIFEIVFNPGTDAKFYINGTLVATHTTNIPTGSLQFFGIGATDAGNLAFISPITFSIEQ